MVLAETVSLSLNVDTLIICGFYFVHIAYEETGLEVIFHLHCL